MARVDTLSHFLMDVANAIRSKKGTSETIQASTFDTEIESIQAGVITEGEYNNALMLSEQILGVVGPQTASSVGPVLNDVLDVEQTTESGGSVSDVELVLDDILGGVS